MRRFAVIAAALAAVAAAGCSSSGSGSSSGASASPSGGTITVFAAASLTESFTQIGKQSRPPTRATT
jgi:molybdate transport system substrate-binding protein